MKTNVTLLSMVAVSASLCGACSLDSGDGNEAAGWTEAALITKNNAELNGFQLNGFQLNGFQLNGFQLNGFQLNGFQLNGFQLNGFQLNGVTLDGTVFKGKLPNGTKVSGAAFEGAELITTLPDGTTLPIKITGIEEGPEPDMTLYTVKYLNDSTWISLCGDDAYGARKAIPLAGRWDPGEGSPAGGSHIDDPGVFTFACRGYVLAHCAEIGYAPWRSTKVCTSKSKCQKVPMRDYHQACTRMMRADYCGDGMPHTVTGVCIDEWDNIGIQSVEEPSWPLEAEWTSKGAGCVSHARWTSNGQGFPNASMNYIEAHCPEKVADDVVGSCGGESSTFYTGAALGVPLADQNILRNASPIPAFGGGCGVPQ